MDNTIDEQILKRLIRANSFINHAREHSFQSNDFDLMIAIHNLDNAVENILRILIDYLNIENETNKTIESAEISSLVGEIQKFCKDKNLASLPFAAEIKRLRVLRNSVQHGAVLPTSEITPLQNIVEKFFKRTLEKFFNLTIDKLKLSTIIKNVQLKQTIIESENFLERNEYLKAIVASRNAFEYAKLIYISSYLSLDKMPLLLNEKNEIIDELVKMSIRIELSSYRINLNQYDYFMEYIRHIPFEHCADWYGNAVLQRDWEKADAEFCYNFVIDTITKFQFSVMPPIEEHEIDINKAVQTIHIIDDIEITTIDELIICSCTYLYPDVTGERFFVGKEVAIKLREAMKLKRNFIFKDITKTLDGKNVRETESNVEVKHFSCHLVSNLIPAWEVNMWYTQKKK